MKALQRYLFPLTQQPYANGGNAVYPLNELPVSIFGRNAHLEGILFDLDATPIFTTAPTINGFWSILQNMVFYDGASERQNLSAAQLRYALISEAGKNPLPDPDLNSGSTNHFYGRMFLPLGPLNMLGYGTDYVLPAGALKSGEVRVTWGGLTAFSADATGLSVVPRLYAVMVALDNQVRVPPAFERRAYNFSTNEFTVQGHALYNSVILLKQNLAAFAAGDLTSLQIDTGMGSVPDTRATALQAVSQLGNLSGIITQLRGEPLSATDDNEKIVNLASPTAISAADATVQAIMGSPMGGRISKILYEASSGLRVKWPGTFATPTVVVSRFLEQPRQAAATIAAKASDALGKGIPSDAKVATLDRRRYRGPREAFMPWVYGLTK